MPRIPDETLEEIRQRADLVDLVSQITPVKKNGSAYWACCPFHQEKTPSFKIDPDKQLYYCFGCKKSGNVFRFVQEMVNTDFIGAAQWLADKLGIIIPESTGGTPQEQDRHRQWKDSCLKLLNDAANWFHANLSLPEAQPAVNYIRSRGLDQDAVRKFRLGYSPDSWDGITRWATRLGYTPEMLLATGLTIKKEDSTSTPYDRFRGRLTFPIQDELGHVVGFSARVLDAEAKTAKYVNSPETDFFQKGKLLYAFNFARQAFKDSGKALICEGQLDVIACHRAGLAYAIAAQGTAFTEFHARLLKRSTNRIVLSFDADGAGQKATIRTTAILHAQGLAVDIVTLPDGEDPDSIFRKGGPQALATFMNQTTPAVPFLFNSLCAAHDRSKPEELSVIVKEILEIIRPLPDPVVKAGHCQWLARQLNIPENIILQELKIVDDGHKSAFENRPIITPKPLAIKEMPAFQIPSVGEQTYQALLELIMHFDFLAEQLAQNDDVLPLIPDTPLGRAILFVIDQVVKGEWSQAEQRLVNSEHSAQSSVGKVLANPVYSQLLPLPEDTNEMKQTKQDKVNAAFTDCLNQLLINDLDIRIRELKNALLTASGEDATRLQRDYCELVTRKNQLKKR